MLGFLTVLVMLIGAYVFVRQGVLPAFVTCCNILLAGLISFNFFEPIATVLDPMVTGSFLHGYEDSFCLIALFSLTLALLRGITKALLRTAIDYHRIVQQGGAVAFGLLAGYLVCGFLLCVAQTMPLDEHFLHFEAHIDARSPGAKLRRILPPDRVWLALMHRASEESLSWEPGPPFDADGSFEPRYGRERRLPEEMKPNPGPRE